MNCDQCKQLLETDAKFCVHCGAKVSPHASMDEEIDSHARSAETGNQYEAAASASHQPTFQRSGRAKEIGSNYLIFLKSGLKSPYQFTKQVNNEHFINGIITLLLFSLFIPISFYFIVKDVLTFTSTFGNLFGQVTPSISFSSVFVKGLFYTAISLAISGLISFGAIKLMKTNVTLKDFTARFGAILIIPTSLSGVAMLLSMTGSMELVVFFLCLASLGFSTSIPLIIASYKKENHQGLDVYYSAILTFTVINVVFYMFLKHQVHTLILQLMQLIQQYTSF